MESDIKGTNYLEVPKPKEKLISNLRKDARSAKECFTKFSFQTLTFTSAALAIVLSTMRDNPYVIFASIPVIGILDIIGRIGIYKFTSANRAHGLQSYIENVENYILFEKNTDHPKTEDENALEMIIKNKNQEQLFRAFRIIEPSILDTIYVIPRQGFFGYFLDELRGWKMYNIKSDFRSVFSQLFDYYEANSEKDDKQIKATSFSWFFIYGLTKRKHRSGSYLRKILGMLQFVKYINFMILFYGGAKIIRQYWIEISRIISSELNIMNNVQAQVSTDVVLFNSVKIVVIASIVMAMFLFLITSRFRFLKRLRIIEKELQSIHGYSVIWNIVVIAHYRAIRHARKSITSTSAQGNIQKFDELYLDQLCLENSKVKSQIHNLSGWFCGST